MTVDLADVREMADVEKAVKAFTQTLEAHSAAHDRLDEAKYPGAENVGYWWGELVGALESLAASLADFREANGDQGAIDYLWYVVDRGLSLHEAAQEILNNTRTDEDFQRIEAMRQYASAV